ncbi:MAG TPA: hypothetical protein VJ302_25685 [Blastocatellia bacterium]|nr:hypothetical protein [Blastocatellia bacterium]
MSEIRLELGEDTPAQTRACCGGETQSIYGFVYQDGDAYAIYHAGWSTAHPESGLDLALTFGEFDDETAPESRYRVGMIIRSAPIQYEFSVIDADQSSWANGPEQFLTRDEVLQHPLRKEFFRIAEHVIDQDQRVATALLAADDESVPE